ncbi:DNA gyrase inhibitor YacG [Cognatiyoonia sp.]|uniref:DNA gyrase inhibitor YacG n=1 Tax=Cognatiyoonia sp. TaxID=2211652 RepID=UPI003F6A2FED
MACPMCEKDSEAKYRPFCSKRCADLDLGKWLSGSYAIPSAAQDEDEELAEALEEQARKPH